MKAVFSAPCVAVGLGFCLAGAQTQTLPTPSPSNTLLQCETTQGFKLLFTGTLASFQGNFSGWVNGTDAVSPVPSDWKYCASDSTICTDSASAQPARSRVKYGDFDLRLDYRDDGDEGIYYRGLTRGGAWYSTAVEFAIQDLPNGLTANQQAGAAFYLIAPNPRTYFTGKWNSVRIVAKGDSVEHWMNNTKVVGYRYWNQRWIDAMNANVIKWGNNNTELAQQTVGCRCYIPSGYFGFQGDHGTDFRIRNLRITSDTAFVHPGPAVCPQTGVKENARPQLDYSIQGLAEGLQITLKNLVVDRINVIGIDGGAPSGVLVESHGAVVQIRGQKLKGLWVVEVFPRGEATPRFIKFFLP